MNVQQWKIDYLYTSTISIKSSLYKKILNISTILVALLILGACRIAPKDTLEQHIDNISLSEMQSITLEDENFGIDLDSAFK